MIVSLFPVNAIWVNSYRFLGHSTSKQAEQILRGEQPAKGLQYAKRAKKLASERKATIDLDNEHLSEIEKYR